MRGNLGILLMVLGLGLGFGAQAGELPSPSGQPILVVSGKISVVNDGTVAKFDRDMLEALGLVTLTTSTPWHNGIMKFEGVSLDRLMKAVGAQGDKVKALALNAYSIEIPIEDFAKFGPILALKMNGKYMTVRDKGPLFVIYPYDSRSELRNQTYYGRSVWQVSKLKIE